MKHIVISIQTLPHVGFESTHLPEACMGLGHLHAHVADQEIVHGGDVDQAAILDLQPIPDGVREVPPLIEAELDDFAGRDCAQESGVLRVIGRHEAVVHAGRDLDPQPEIVVAHVRPKPLEETVADGDDGAAVTAVADRRELQLLVRAVPYEEPNSLALRMRGRKEIPAVQHASRRQGLVEDGR